MAESENYTYKGLSQRRSAIYPAGCPQMFSCEAGTVPDPDALHPSVEHYPLTYHENLPLIFPNGSLARRLPAWQLLTIVTFLPHPGEREPSIIADSPCHFFSACTVYHQCSLHKNISISCFPAKFSAALTLPLNPRSHIEDPVDFPKP